jgi:hypothetical protein
MDIEIARRPRRERPSDGLGRGRVNAQERQPEGGEARSRNRTPTLRYRETTPEAQLLTLPAVSNDLMLEASILFGVQMPDYGPTLRVPS